MKVASKVKALEKAIKTPINPNDNREDDLKHDDKEKVGQSESSQQGGAKKDRGRENDSTYNLSSFDKEKAHLSDNTEENSNQRPMNAIHELSVKVSSVIKNMSGLNLVIDLNHQAIQKSDFIKQKKNELILNFK